MKVMSKVKQYYNGNWQDLNINIEFESLADAKEYAAECSEDVDSIFGAFYGRSSLRAAFKDGEALDLSDGFDPEDEGEGSAYSVYMADVVQTQTDTFEDAATKAKELSELHYSIAWAVDEDGNGNCIRVRYFFRGLELAPVQNVS